MSVNSFMDNSYDDILTKALTNYNNALMEGLPEIVEAHDFSGRFERKMNRLIRADKRFGGKRWMEACVRYSTSVAVALICFIVINTLSISAFNFNLWDIIVDNTGDMINIKFENAKSGSAPEIEATEEKSTAKKKSEEAGGTHYKIGMIPEGYVIQEQYSSDELVVEILESNNGTITYTEGPITDTADINIAKGEREAEIIGAKEVTLIHGENNLTAFFTDNSYYHIVEIQGQDADKEMAVKIIEGLEEQ